MKKQIGLIVITAAYTGIASTWNPDVAVGAKWSEAANWSDGVPGSADPAVFQNTQADTYDVDVDTAGATRLLQVGQQHTFNGAGLIRITTTATSLFQPVMYNTTAGTVTYNAPVSVNVSSASNYYGLITNSIGTGKTVFNGSFSLEAGSAMGVNLANGTFEFNGDLTVNDTLRLGFGKTIIGGSGTTLIGGPGYILTAGAGSELHLNRTGAYTLADNVNGYLRVEKTKVVFNAADACADGTNVRLIQTADTGMLVSGGNYDQNFGYLVAGGVSMATDIDMANSTCVWTFADSSAVPWNNLTITNAGNATIRFKMNLAGGTIGLRDKQIDQIILDGVALSSTNVFEEDGYLYLCKPESAGQITGSHDPVYVGYYRGSAMDEGLYAFTNLADPLGTASRVGTGSFPEPTWQSVGFDGSNCYVFNRGSDFNGPGLYRYDGAVSYSLISGEYDFSDWHGIGFCNGVYYGLYHGTAMNGAGLYIFMDATDPEGTAVRLCKSRVFSSNLWTDVAFDGERYLFVRTGADGGDPGIYQYDPDSNEFSKISGSETYTDWQGLGVFDADIAPLKNKKAYVLLFGGQSNALGWGYRQYLLDTGNPLAYPQPDIDMLHGLNLYVPNDTLVFLQSGTANIVVKPLPNHYPDLTDAPISRFSSELSFARRVRDQISISDVRLGIVKYALGGTSLYDIADWRPDGTADRSADGPLYQIFQRTVWKCIAAMKNKYPYYSVEILGMGWMQGESDAIEGHGEEYEDNLTRFVTDVRTTFGVADMPFVLSKLSTNQLEGAPQTELDQWPIVTAAQIAVAAADPNVVATDTEGPNYAVSVGYSEGRYHYTSPALLQIGEDLANALISICRVDSDNDGLLDEWENNYAPGTAGLGNTPDADYDQDGFTDREEFQLGTNPVDPEDYLQLFGTSQKGHWTVHPGVTYQMMYSTNLTTWSAIGAPCLFANSEAETGFDFSEYIPGSGGAFFRLIAR